MKRLLFVALGALALSGCYTTTLKSGKPAGESPMEADDRWHNGFVGGTSEASGPYRLEQLCPHGWSEIKTHTSFGNGLLEVVTLSLYNPQTIDVRCAAEPETTAKAEIESLPEPAREEKPSEPEKTE
jgi:hypothetical protein